MTAADAITVVVLVGCVFWLIVAAFGEDAE